MGPITTFVKAGSYLLHWNSFSTLRDLILDKSLFVLQDDTAVPYRFFKSGGWEVRLFGRYATPVKDFTNVEQKDLREAYEEPKAKRQAPAFSLWLSLADAGGQPAPGETSAPALTRVARPVRFERTTCGFEVPSRAYGEGPLFRGDRFVFL